MRGVKMAKKIQNVTLQIFSRLDLTSEKNLKLRDMNLSPKEYSRRWKETEFESEGSKRLLRFIADYDNGFFCPEKCDVYEPVREIFDPDNLRDPVRWLSQTSGMVMFKKSKLFRYEGFVENRRFPNFWVAGNEKPEPRSADPIFLTEWCLWLRVKLLKLKSIEYVRRFFIELALVSEADFGFMTMQEDHEKKNYLITKEDGQIVSQRFVGDNLEVCLPGVYWGNIFGKLYVDWFGEKKFLTLPCYLKEKLPGGSYYVQSSDDLYYFDKPKAINHDKAIRKHLNARAFFDIRYPKRRCDVPDYVRKHRRRADPLSV